MYRCARFDRVPIYVARRLSKVTTNDVTLTPIYREYDGTQRICFHQGTAR
jgi:hypothetical protein